MANLGSNDTPGKFESVDAEELNRINFAEQFTTGGSGTPNDPFTFPKISLGENARYHFPAGEYNGEKIEVDDSFDWEEGAIILSGEHVRTTELNAPESIDQHGFYYNYIGGDTGNFGGIEKMSIHGAGDGVGPQLPLVLFAAGIIDCFLDRVILRYTDGDLIVIDNSISGMRFTNSWWENCTGWALDHRGTSGTRAKIENIHIFNVGGGLRFQGDFSQLGGITVDDTGENPAFHVTGSLNSFNGIWTREAYGDQNGGIGQDAGNEASIRDIGGRNQWSNITIESAGIGLLLDGSSSNVTNLGVSDSFRYNLQITGDNNTVANYYAENHGNDVMLIGGNANTISNVVVKQENTGQTDQRVLRINSGADYNCINGLDATQHYDPIITVVGGEENVIRGVRGVPYANISDSGTRTLINGWGTNDGDPNTTGQWNGHADYAGLMGATVYDTTTSPWTEYRPTPNGDWSAQ